MKVHLILFLFLGFALLQGCRPDGLSAEDYMKYVDDPSNGLIREKEVGDFIIGLQYRPAEYETIMQTGLNNLTQSAFDENLKEEKKLQFFVLRIGSADKKTDVLAQGITDQQEYYKRIEYLNAGIDKDIYLVDGTDTLSCVLHHFERTFHLAHFNTIMLAFENPHPDHIEDKTLVFDDKVFGIGRMKLTIDKKNIKNIPAIEL